MRPAGLDDLVRLARDESGQDLLEYGLLTATVVAGGVVLFPTIVAAMSALIGTWGPAVNSVWESPPPQ